MTAALLEKSHGKPRAIGARPSDLRRVDTAARRTRDHNPNGTFRERNEAAKGARGKQASIKHLRAAHRRAQEARSRGETPARADLVLEGALVLYQAAKRDLGAESILVLKPLAVWAENTERARDLGELADEAGVATPEGERLLARRDALEGRATRALTAALAAASALPVRGSGAKDPMHDAILGASVPKGDR